MDFTDRASELEEMYRSAAISNTRARHQDMPDEDEHGRYCLDCSDVIPPPRVAAVDAVRCVRCQTKREAK